MLILHYTNGMSSREIAETTGYGKTTYKTMAEAYKRKKEVEYKKAAKTFTVPKCTILNELLKEYVEMYGKVNWSMSTYTINSSLIDNYISPLIGTLYEFTVHVSTHRLLWWETDR